MGAYHLCAIYGPEPVLAKMVLRYYKDTSGRKQKWLSCAVIAVQQRRLLRYRQGLEFKGSGRVRKSTKIDGFRVGDAERHDPIRISWESVPNIGF
jgi:hypothetical protein